MILILKIGFGSGSGENRLCVAEALSPRKPHNSSFGTEQGMLRLLRTQPHRKYQSVVHNSLLRTHQFVLVPKLPLLVKIRSTKVTQPIQPLSFLHAIHIRPIWPFLIEETLSTSGKFHIDNVSCKMMYVCLTMQMKFDAVGL